MAHWFDLRDLVSISQLQRRGIQLDLERAMLWQHSPFWAALTEYLPFSPFRAESIVLYTPGRHRRPLGFVQFRARRRRPEADVTFISPTLDASEDAVSIWYRLLAECTQRIGDRGGQRLFAQIPDGDGAEDVFRQAGFTTYAHEDIYVLSDRPRDLTKTFLLRRQRSRDAWNLLRLYSQTTPRPVQIAEGMLSVEGRTGRLVDWWEQAHGSGYVLPAGTDLAGAVRIHRGSSGYWLRFWLNPQAHDHGEMLLRGALSILWAAPRRPIYASVREYESGLRAPLEQAGFGFWLTCSLLVKHTTARVKEPLIKLVPSLEKRTEPAASVAHHLQSGRV